MMTTCAVTTSPMLDSIPQPTDMKKDLASHSILRPFGSVLSLTLLLLILLPSCSRKLGDGDYTLHVLSTNDVHGTWFDSTYIGGQPKKSLLAMKYYIDSVRTLYGKENVVLVDAGDCLQGDNATYYYNFVDTVSPHPFPRLMKYMGYDAIAAGNHDFETGHTVYDRVQEDLVRFDTPFLAGNALRLDDYKTYFPLYKVVRRAGLKIAILGYTNANIKAWIAEELYDGITFEPIVKLVQQDIDNVRKVEKPDVMIVTMHSACGQGDGTILEAEALDIFNAVGGIDFLVCGHDHRPRVETRDTVALLNSGSHSRFVAHGTMKLHVQKGKVTSRSFDTELIPVDADKADPEMREAFRAEFEAVRAFTTKEIGDLDVDLRTRDAYAGMSPYINLIHTVGLGCEPAEISIAAPLTYNASVGRGKLIFNDLFTIYPFENQLYVVKMTGEQVRNYLEASYDRWIRTISSPSEHILNIRERKDPMTLSTGWSFLERSYNFDSAAGINYTVDVTRGRGNRVRISSMADGSAFETDRTYNVAMTSYRASGGGGLLKEAGVDSDNVGAITVARFPEIRNIIYDYISRNGSIEEAAISDPRVIGHWEFVPQRIAKPAMDRDMALLFGKD